MQRIGGGRREHHFGVASDFDGLRTPVVIGDRDAAQLDIVFGRDRDFQVRIVVAVAAPELERVLELRL